jgi:hypothetical protein
LQAFLGGERGAYRLAQAAVAEVEER